MQKRDHLHTLYNNQLFFSLHNKDTYIRIAGNKADSLQELMSILFQSFIACFNPYKFFNIL